MFLGILEFIVKAKKKIRENCFENVVSEKKRKEKCPMFPQNYFKKKVQKLKKIKTQKSLADFWDKTSSFGKFVRPHFENSFP